LVFTAFLLDVLKVCPSARHCILYLGVVRQIIIVSRGGIAQLIERWASTQKVAKPRLDSRCGSASRVLKKNA